jgi:acyl-CoA synthetase (AMP-forming)/AMP-acid ligase II
LVKTFDLHTVDDILTGAAPLGAEIYSRVEEMFPRWKVREGYGMSLILKSFWVSLSAYDVEPFSPSAGLTETAACVATTKPDDIWLGSVGALLPSIECRLLTPEGIEVEGYDNSGELWVRSPSVTLGYFNNDRATAESFQNGWHRTGDEALFRVSPNGKEHLFIIDRIKELIKVKGNQVAPAELEEHLLLHPVVAEAAVIPVYDADAGEVPKAFIVKASSYTGGETEVELAEQLEKHVRDHKSRVKWLTGGVEFVTEIPRSTSGKIMRRLLRDMERERRARSLSKL